MTTRSQHRIIELDADASRDLLARHRTRVGRVAFAEDGDPDWPTVLPVNYAYQNGQVYFRTFEGSKLYAALRHLRVAFEVDHVDQSWQEGWSVMVRGTLVLVQDAATRDAIEGALTSWATGGDEQLVALSTEEITGRRVIGPTPS